MRQLEAGLRQALPALGLSLSDRQVGQCLDYLELIAKWNRVYNLTAVSEPGQMLTHHLLDSLAVIRPMLARMGQGAFRVLDVGSGAGLPGVVIALVCPQAEVVCIDTVQKKTVFIQQVGGSLGLGNLKSVHARVEEARIGTFDLITSRAFASLADFARLTRFHVKQSPGQTRWMALKGRHPAGEIAALPADIHVTATEELNVPGLDEARCVVWMELSAQTQAT